MSKAKQVSNENYAELKAELDQIVELLQDEELDIDEAVEKYRRGLTIINDLEAYLAQAENKIQELKSSLANSTKSKK